MLKCCVNVCCEFGVCNVYELVLASKWYVNWADANEMHKRKPIQVIDCCYMKKREDFRVNIRHKYRSKKALMQHCDSLSIIHHLLIEPMASCGQNETDKSVELINLIRIDLISSRRLWKLAMIENVLVFLVNCPAHTLLH